MIWIASNIYQILSTSILNASSQSKQGRVGESICKLAFNLLINCGVSIWWCEHVSLVSPGVPALSSGVSGDSGVGVLNMFWYQRQDVLGPQSRGHYWQDNRSSEQNKNRWWLNLSLDLGFLVFLFLCHIHSTENCSMMQKCDVWCVIHILSTGS